MNQSVASVEVSHIQNIQSHSHIHFSDIADTIFTYFRHVWACHINNIYIIYVIYINNIKYTYYIYIYIHIIHIILYIYYIYIYIYINNSRRHFFKIRYFESYESSLKILKIPNITDLKNIDINLTFIQKALKVSMYVYISLYEWNVIMIVWMKLDCVKKLNNISRHIFPFLKYFDTFLSK